MKKLLLLLAMFGIANSSFAQMDKKMLPKPGIILGKVIDEQTKEPLPYVNIVVKDTAEKLLTGGITELDGTFKIKGLPKGTSIIEFQFIGYTTQQKQIRIEKSNRVDLGLIALKEDSTTLEEVEIRAETSTVIQKIDRKVINVGKDLTSAGATASELLNNVQSVNVDSQTGALSLRGNSNVRVLVDGKPTNVSTAQLLQQLPSTSIKSIELITNPSAKYNPEGMSGIINIILNKNANIGFNASVNTGVTRGRNTRYNGSFDMNYKTGKVNFYSNYGYNSGKNNNFGYVYRTGTIPLNQDFVFNNENTSHLLKLGADIYVDDANTLSVYTTQNFSEIDAIGSTIVSQNGTIITNAPNRSDSDDVRSSAYNFNYKRAFAKKGHSIEFEATYSDAKTPEYAVYDELISNESFYNDVESRRENTLLNIDYTNPISENGKLELGAELRIDNTKNQFETSQAGFNNSSFRYERTMTSAYATYGHKFEKVTLQVGARFEQYDVIGNFVNGNETADYTSDIFSIYPSAFITYNPSDKNQFQWSYSRRVDRPSISQVNPIREWATPLINSLGNPDLLPQFTNSFEMNYTRNLNKGSLTFGAFYRRVNDEISTVLYKDPNDNTDTKQIRTDVNFSGNDRFGFELSSNYRIASWWRANASMDLYSQTLKGVTSGVNKEVQADIFNARISNSFTATKRLRFQLFAMYQGRRQNLQFDVDPMWMINSGASYSVFEGKGSITFRMNDIFNAMRFKFKSTDPFVQNGQFNWESQTAYIGFNYRFGGGKNRALRRKQRDNNEKQGGGGFL